MAQRRRPPEPRPKIYTSSRPTPDNPVCQVLDIPLECKM